MVEFCVPICQVHKYLIFMYIVHHTCLAPVHFSSLVFSVFDFFPIRKLLFLSCYVLQLLFCWRFWLVDPVNP